MASIKRCALCDKGTDNYLTFVGHSVVGINCATKNGMAKDGEFTEIAKKYADWHTVGQLEKMLDEFGEFDPKQAKIENKNIENQNSRKEIPHLRNQHQQFDNEQPRKHHSFFYYVGVVVVVIFCINFVIGFIHGCSNAMDDDSSGSSVTEKKMTAAERAKFNWKNKRISFSDGVFKIKRIAKIKAYTFGSDLVPGLLLVGTYTNKTNEAESVTDFLDNHTGVTNIGKKTESDMDPTGYRESSPEYRQLFRNADDKTRPHKTVKCAVHYMSDHGLGEDIPNKFRFQIINNETDDHILYTVNLQNLPIVTTNITLDK